MNKKEQKFVEVVWGYYRRHGRRSLPWRLTTNPYRILVSEIMLQQTQVDRVIPKYIAFLKMFPSLATLARAPLGDVLREWQGLGYNRRAKMLHECAQTITNDYRGRLPRTHAELMKLPGIGHYTAGAILAFAYGEGVPIIETNIRMVFLHHFFRDAHDVSDVEILKYVTRTLDNENARAWYYALMDYGAHLKKIIPHQNSRSRHYTKQSPFQNSDRQIRGGIIRALTEKLCSKKSLRNALVFPESRIELQLQKLIAEGMIVEKGNQFGLPTE
jgi:A/G-specific adenine glycosylase